MGGFLGRATVTFPQRVHFGVVSGLRSSLVSIGGWEYLLDSAAAVLEALVLARVRSACA